LFNNVYKNKKVLITGNTGFKGAWLSLWLKKLGAEVIGLADSIPTEPSLFKTANLESHYLHYFKDITDLEAIVNVIDEHKPDFVFHLAAQAIVSESYKKPLETIMTNVNGTATVLESLRLTNNKTIAVIITSDKCYENIEWSWGYKESDHIGGKDIYSGSKGAAEIIFHAYYESFFKDENCNIKLSSARAGNVIGGGDWAKDRIIVDCIKSWSQNKKVEIRSPHATRPWQHVLEPLSGYLHLGAELYNNNKLHGESFNFGPKSEKNKTVQNLLDDLGVFWGYSETNPGYIIKEIATFHEAGLLKLNCDKALFHLDWEATLSYIECMNFVGSWYKTFYQDSIKSNQCMADFTISQILEYENIAAINGLIWTK
jgi:CDP-glucose 4,6-dehydratase